MAKTRLRVALILSVLCFPVAVATAQGSPAAAPPDGQQVIAQVPSPLSLEVIPIADFPLGDSARYFGFGGGADINLRYQLPGSLFHLLGGIEYSFIPDLATDSLSLAAVRVGAGVRVPLGAGIGVLGWAGGGYFFATFNDLSLSSSNPYAAAGVSLQFSLNPSFRLGAGAQYRYCAGLYQGLSATLGTSIAMGNLGGSVTVPRIELRPAFPVFYKYYDDHPIGELQIKSNLGVPATNISAQVYIKQFMDAPKRVQVPGVLSPGETRSVDMFALFTDKVLSITEGTKVAAEVSISYVIDGQSYEDKSVETMTLLGRNAMTWDDNRKAAAYVTAKDPLVLSFARSVTGYVRGKESRAINDKLQAAVALHEALDLFGLNYTPNPVTPYSETSTRKDVIDFLQFPAETFKYQAGDCSDISILYTALLQAVGIDCAFITIPGHIFVAVNSGVAPEKARAALLPAGMYIARGGRAWIPVEITMRHQGFLKAWELGAKEWNENNPVGQAGFYPVQEAWKVYQPVGLPGMQTDVAVPSLDAVLAAYMAEMQRYVDRAISPLVVSLQAQIQAEASPAAMNSLGILYAKFGQTDKAERQFKQILKGRSYLPAILNLGNLYYARGDAASALRFYRQAEEVDPRNPRVLLNLARTNQDLQNYDEAARCYQELKQIDPGLADQFAMLGQGGGTGSRAAETERQRRVVLWEGD